MSRPSPGRSTPTSFPSTVVASALPYCVAQRVAHLADISQPSTPRRSSNDVQQQRTAMDADGAPEGFLAPETGLLSASFSVAPRSGSEDTVPTICALDMVCVQDASERGGVGSAPIFCVTVGDSLGRVDHYETRGGNLPLRGGNHTRLIRKHSHQAFVGEFDCLTSSAIDERVNCVRYLHPHRSPGVVSYLAANERTIKLFRVRQEPPCNLAAALFPASSGNSSPAGSASSSSPSTITPRAHKRVLMPFRAFTGTHKSPIQDISICADGDTFLSVDDLQVHWWQLEAQDTSRATCIADVSPDSGKLDDVNQLITTVSFHPTHGSLFLLGRSNGLLSIGDLRDPPCRRPRNFSANFQLMPEHNSVQHEEHNDILTSISSASFLGGYSLVSRDYFGLKLWDTRRADGGPVSTASVLSCLSPFLDSLYDSDAIFDRFCLAVNEDSKSVVTGCYGGLVAVWNPFKESSAMEKFDVYATGTDDDASKFGRIDATELGRRFSEGLSTADRAAKVLHVSMSPGGERICCSTATYLSVLCREAV